MIYFLKHVSFIVERLLYQSFPTCKYLGDKKKIRKGMVCVCVFFKDVCISNKQTKPKR